MTQFLGGNTKYTEYESKNSIQLHLLHSRKFTSFKKRFHSARKLIAPIFTSLPELIHTGIWTNTSIRQRFEDMPHGWE